MSNRRNILLLCTIIFLILCMPLSTYAEGKSWHQYIGKYDSLTISPNQMQRLSRYSHLINYFSRFTFFNAEQKVSPNFIRALILAESNGDTQAISNKDALGLGQILLSTGREAARELYATGISFRYIERERLRKLQREDLFDPAINILLTCYLISKYNDKFSGRLELVVSAWNAGEYTDSLKSGEPPPYQETYSLIGKINGYYLYLYHHQNRLLF